MKEFKPLKELVKALTYIGDAIAGTNKSSNSQGESNDVYDGFLKATRNNDTVIIIFSFGITDNDNATKLGDLFTDNFINDLNNYFINDLTGDEDEFYVSTVGKVNNYSDFNDGNILFYYDNGILEIDRFNDHGGMKVSYKIALSDEPLTKDTPLQKINDGN